MPINLKTPFINIGSAMSSSSENDGEKKSESDEDTITTEDLAPTCPLTTADDDSSSAQELHVSSKEKTSSGEVKSVPAKPQKETLDDLVLNVFMHEISSAENEIFESEKAIVHLEEKPYNEKIEIVKKEPTPPARTVSQDVLPGGLLSKLSNIFSFIKFM